MIGEGFAVQQPASRIVYGKDIGLTLWPVSQVPLRSSVRSLGLDMLNQTNYLKGISVLAVFSYLPKDVEIEDDNDCDFDVEKFQDAFDPECFKQPINLANGSGFCFVLTGKEANCLCRGRCISFTKVIGQRPIAGGKVRRCNQLWELFPCFTKFSLRFPKVRAPPHTETSFLPLKKSLESISKFKGTTDTSELLWQKSDKIDRWRKHLTSITESIFIGSEYIGRNEKILKNAGITHIINCASQVVSSCPGFVQMNIPMNDGGDENVLSHLFSAAVFIDSALESNGKVLVHCIEGVSRSVAVVIGYLILKQKIGYQAAFKLVREKRRVAGPNPKFIAQLLQLSEVVGATEARTCFFSQTKKIPFEIRLKNDRLVAVPLYQEPRADPGNNCLVTIDYSSHTSISKRDVGAPATVSLKPGSSCKDDMVSFANSFIQDLCACLRVADVRKKPNLDVHMYAYPEWNEVPPSTIDNIDPEKIYIVVDGGAFKMIVGADVDGDLDLDAEMENCCAVIGKEPPASFGLVDLGCE